MKFSLSLILREAFATAKSQPVASLMTVVMVAGMAIAVLLTTGQTAAAERAALAQINAIGTRSIIVRANPQAGLTTAILDRLSTLDGIESVTAFGALIDARNSQVNGAPSIGIRPIYGTMANGLQSGVVYASASAANRLGLLDGTGGIVTNAGQYLTVVGRLDVPEYLEFLEPLAAFIPDIASKIGMANSGQFAEPITTLVVLATEPNNVVPVTRALVTLLAVPNPEDITIETSAALAYLHAAVSGQLGQYGRTLVLSILGVAGILVAANLFGLVQMRRKDYGRRRALGASQSLIIGLLLTQTAILATIGAVVGAIAALTISSTMGNPLPGAGFTIAVVVAAIYVATLAALAPAVAASRRDPLYELRVA